MYAGCLCQGQSPSRRQGYVPPSPSIFLFCSAHASPRQPILGLNYKPMPAQAGCARTGRGQCRCACLNFPIFFLGLITTSTCGDFLLGPRLTWPRHPHCPALEEKEAPVEATCKLRDFTEFRQATKVVVFFRA
jgi:hypothetical protein